MPHIGNAKTIPARKTDEEIREDTIKPKEKRASTIQTPKESIAAHAQAARRDRMGLSLRRPK